MPDTRADSSARRELILDAADFVFCEHGVTAPLDLVVQRADVGRATLYRNFPDRAALMRALLERRFRRLEETARQYAERDDALFHLFERIARYVVESAPLSDYWRTIDQDDAMLARIHARVSDIFKAPLQRALDAGLCRSDLQLTDISLISGMLGAALRGRSRNEREVLAQRALELLRTGLVGPGAATTHTGARIRD